MSNLNSFYFDLLNINRKSNMFDISEVVKNVTFEINKHTTSSEGLCKVYANHISFALNEKSITNMIVNLDEVSTSNYEHQFVIAMLKEKDELSYILIDPSYSQFVKDTSKVLRNVFPTWPGDILKHAPKGEQMASDLTKNGLTEIDEEKFSSYVSSFSANKTKNLNDLFVDKLKSK